MLGWLQYWVRHSFSSSMGGGSSQYETIMSGLLIVVFVLFFHDGAVEGLKPYRLRAGWNRIRNLSRPAQPPAADGVISSSGSSSST